MNVLAPARAHVSKITNASLKALKPSNKPRKVSVGGGLHLRISVGGSKTWNLVYRFGARQRTLRIGLFPYVDLDRARAEAYAARQLIESGLDPVVIREKERLKNMRIHAETLGVLCTEWLAHREGEVAAHTSRQSRRWLELYVINRPIGNFPAAEVTASQVHQLIKGVADGTVRTGVERKHGAPHIARKLKQILHGVMAYGISTGRLTVNVVSMIATKHAVKTPPTRHNKALPPEDVRALLETVDRSKRSMVVKSIIATVLLTGCRTHEALLSRWLEFDLDAAIWSIPAERMKNRRPHDVPLSAQLTARLRALRAVSPRTEPNDHVFYSPKGGASPHLSPGALNAVFFQLGLNNENWFRTHGARGSIATWAYESGQYRSEVIERYLSHIERNKIKLAYTSSARYLGERRSLAQAWADIIDSQYSELSRSCKAQAPTPKSASRIAVVDATPAVT